MTPVIQMAPAEEAPTEQQLDLESHLDEDGSPDGLPSLAVLTKAFAETEGNGNGHAKDPVRD